LAIRDNIKTELKNKLISLKADCCTRLGRSVIGINVQFISDAKIVVRTLAIRRIFVRHTNLKDLIENVLKEYHLSFLNIITVTTDNGSNFLKAISLCKNLKQNEENEGNV
jgi:hypothetical protein